VNRVLQEENIIGIIQLDNMHRYIDISKYKQALRNCISEALEIAKHPVKDLAKEFGVNLHQENNNGYMMKNLPAV
jgi:hypothetical protein